MKYIFLFLSFWPFYLRGVQLVSLIIPSIAYPNHCFVDKDDELDESVIMDVDRVVVVNARDDMEIHNDPMVVKQDLLDLIEID
jgi:hypothetical protein